MTLVWLLPIILAFEASIKRHYYLCRETEKGVISFFGEMDPNDTEIGTSFLSCISIRLESRFCNIEQHHPNAQDPRKNSTVSITSIHPYQHIHQVHFTSS